MKPSIHFTSHRPKSRAAQLILCSSFRVVEKMLKCEKKQILTSDELDLKDQQNYC